MALITPSRATGQLFGPVGRVVKAGFITDLHHDPIKAVDPTQGTKNYMDAAEKAADIKTIFDARGDLSFRFQNGDFIDGSNSQSVALVDIADITAIYQPDFSTIGNHEMWMLTKAQVISALGIPNAYYYFERGGVRFIVLDGNYVSDSDGASNEETSISGNTSPYISYVNPTQRTWLADTISESLYPCVIFCHFPLYYSGAFGWGLTNAAAVRTILEAASDKVIGCIGGHLHDNYSRIINDILYVTTHAATTGVYPQLNYSILSVYPDAMQMKLESVGYSGTHVKA